MSPKFLNSNALISIICHCSRAMSTDIIYILYVNTGFRIAFLMHAVFPLQRLLSYEMHRS